MGTTNEIQKVSSTHPSLGQYSVLVVWFALLAGFVELLNLGVRKLVFGQMVFAGPQAVWMIPLSYLVYFTGFGLAIGVIAWLLPRLMTWRVTVLLWGFIAGFSVLFLFYPKISKTAIGILALGLAVQLSRWSSTQPQKFQLFVKRSAAWMAVLFLGAGLGYNGWNSLREYRALANAPALPPGTPNVLLITLDTVRAQSMSLYGNPRPTTPYLERLAKQGVVFEQAIATAPWTTPSHASMFTGEWPHQLSQRWKVVDPEQIDASHRMLAEVLGASGFATAGFVANVEMAGSETGLSRGFIHYEDYPLSLGEFFISSAIGRFIINSPRLRRFLNYYDQVNRKTAKSVNSDFLSWLAGHRSKPFFAFLNYFDAHEPYIPYKPFDTMFGPKNLRKNFMILHWRAHQAKREEKQTMSAAEVQQELDAYEGLIAYMDQQLQVLFDDLEKQGILQNTLVIITADHGEQFGEHGLFEHVNSLYSQLLHVPLIMVLPSRLPQGEKITAPVTLRDLPATVVDLLKIGGTEPFPGSSLARYWNRDVNTAEPARVPLLSEVDSIPNIPQYWPIFKGDMKSLLNDQYHYIRNGDGREEVYDWRADSREERNLAPAMDGSDALAQFRTILSSMLGTNPSKDPVAKHVGN